MFYLGWWIGGCVRRVGWLVGVVWVFEVCFKEFLENLDVFMFVVFFWGIYIKKCV